MRVCGAAVKRDRWGDFATRFLRGFLRDFSTRSCSFLM